MDIIGLLIFLGSIAILGIILLVRDIINGDINYLQ